VTDTTNKKKILVVEDEPDIRELVRYNLEQAGFRVVEAEGGDAALHQVRSEWQNTMPTVYPCVPGHEIVARVTKVGSAVRKFKEGDLAAVGCLVDSDRTCSACREGLEQFCEGPATFTYNGADKHLGGVTYGGYSDSLVVDEAFVLRVSDRVDLAGTAPLLCAGITTYSPLRHWNVRKGQKVGVVGLGGLGHMAVKLANAFGARVVVFTTSPGKAEDADSGHRRNRWPWRERQPHQRVCPDRPCIPSRRT
jgi:D-arabinose 1-dehydrogenase-like Zn-dependent alcohol dehydrogenase